MDTKAPEDVWDDTILIKAYDKSVKLAKEELAKRIAKSTNRIPDKKSSKECLPSSNSVDVGLKLGDHVRATYDDGVDYEAKIIAINNETCTVKYVGYENEQHVRTSDLVTSWGKTARKLQFEKAKQDKNDVPIHNKKKNNSINHLPAPPPMPPMLNDLTEDSEHISAMLMSWYMSGYYTGLYQGQKNAKTNKYKKKN